MKKADITVEYIQHCGDDLTVANAARVSFDKASEWDTNVISDLNGYEDLVDKGWSDVTQYDYDHCIRLQKLKDSDAKLINYLAKHKHFSPFNHSFITLRVKAPIFVARQLVKHKFMPINEVSRRYVDTEPEFYFPEYWRQKANNVKQGSSTDRCDAVYSREQFQLGDGSFYEYPSLVEDVEATIAASLYNYKALLSLGTCAEQARMVLPQNMMTSWYWSGTLGAYCDMLRLRLDSHTQYETRIVATKAHEIIKERFPISVKSLLEN